MRFKMRGAADGQAGLEARAAGGFTLIAVLLLVALAALLMVGLLALVRTDTRRVAVERDMVEARANARYALSLALSEIQRYAGPDQAVSARADILDEEIANPNWAGIWHATEAGRGEGSLGAFLVSGNEGYEITESTVTYPSGYQDPATALPDPEPENGILWMVDKSAGEVTAERDPRVKVRMQEVLDPERGDVRGRVAYWVGDEGVKAKVNLADPYIGEDDEVSRMRRFQVAQRTGAEHVLAGFDPADVRVGAAETLGEVGLLAGDLEGAHAQFHDLTTSGFGLHTDTRNGGLKRDLTMAFEKGEIFKREFGVTAIRPPTTSATVDFKDIYELDTSRLADFYLDPEILATAVAANSDVGRWLGGPNWGNLREYYLLYQRTSFPTLPHPLNAVKMRFYSWNPYKHGKIEDKRDYYHRNSPVVPVLARAQVNLRLRTKKISGGDGVSPPTYTVDWEVKPVIALWNPFNVAFPARTFTFDWEVSASMRLVVGGQARDYDLSMLWSSSNDEWLRIQTKNALDLQPGEIRLLTTDSRAPIRQQINLVPRWDEAGAFFVTLPDVPPTNPGSAGPPLVVKGDEEIEVEWVKLIATRTRTQSGAMLELQKHNTFFALKYRETAAGGTAAVEDSSVRMSNLWQAHDDAGPLVVTGVPPIDPASAEADGAPLASWAYYLRTAREDALGMRNFIDSNVRAIVANSRWDGSVEGRGYRAVSWLGDGSDRAALPPGNDEPETDGLARYRGFGGNAMGASGQTHLILFDVPREPLLSLGQLQHATLGRYNNEPSFVFGNSYHNIRIPPDATVKRNFGMHDSKGLYNSAGLDVFDLSYRVNEKVWDSYFFSGIPGDLSDAELEALRNPSSTSGDPHHLPNARVKIYDPARKLVAADLTSDSDADGYRALGARVLIDGAFNVNSTSVTAWKTVLSSLSDLKIPIYNTTTGTLDRWVDGAIAFYRLSRPYDSGFDAEDGSTNAKYWRGYRELTEEQVTRIAEEMVSEVRLRGPFRSFAEFVNRSLTDLDSRPGAEFDTRLAGALQTALDRVAGANEGLDPAIAAAPHKLPDTGAYGWSFHDFPEAATQGTGFAGFLLQGDVLQALAPALSARSDTFRIRAYGDRVVTLRDGTEEVRARAWCEAIVQRFPEPVESFGGRSSEEKDLMQSPADVKANFHDVGRPYFGRKFRVIAFRWLDASEV